MYDRLLTFAVIISVPHLLLPLGLCRAGKTQSTGTSPFPTGTAFHQGVLISSMHESSEAAPKPLSDSGCVAPQRKYPFLHVVTSDRKSLRGTLDDVSGDSLILINVTDPDLPPYEQRLDTTTIMIPEISYVSIPRQSYIVRGIGFGLVPGAVWALLRLARGDEPEDPAAFAAFGRMLLGGAVGIPVGASIGGLRGVDFEVPWQDRSLEEKQTIIRKLASGKYPPRFRIRGGPWVGATLSSDPSKEGVATAGCRLFCYFTPRWAFALNYGHVSWFNTSEVASETERSKVDYLSAGFLMFLTPKRIRNPFFVSWSWGWGFTARDRTWRSYYTTGQYQYKSARNTDDGFCMSLDTGAWIPFTRWLSVDVRIAYVFGLIGARHVGYHVGLNVGQSF